MDNEKEKIDNIKRGSEIPECAANKSLLSFREFWGVFYCLQKKIKTNIEQTLPLPSRKRVVGSLGVSGAGSSRWGRHWGRETQ